MTPKEKAKELIKKFDVIHYIKLSRGRELPVSMHDTQVKACALIAVQYIITSNPHSNPFNTDVHSTMDYWQQVKIEIEKL